MVGADINCRLHFILGNAFSRRKSSNESTDDLLRCQGNAFLRNYRHIMRRTSEVIQVVCRISLTNGLCYICNVTLVCFVIYPKICVML